jgi:Cof subfamily protein (haloacid dehalogenase superfamily)
MHKHLNPENIKALALDLDGSTLLPDGTLGERTRKTLAACAGRGLQIIICTGRSTDAAERYRLALDARGPMVYYNGAEVVDTPSGTVLSAALLNTEVVDFGIDLSRREGVYFQVYFPGPAFPQDSGNELVAERQCAETEMYLNHTGIQARIGDLKEAAARHPRGCIKCMFLGEHETLETLRPELTGRFGDRIFVTRSYRSFLEILDAGASKGAGLRRAMEFRGLRPDEVIALGDDENDLPMFGAAGFSIAPANAKETVRNQADLVIGSNAEEGLAEFLEDLFKLGNR